MVNKNPKNRPSTQEILDSDEYKQWEKIASTKANKQQRNL